MRKTRGNEVIIFNYAYVFINHNKFVYRNSMWYFEENYEKKMNENLFVFEKKQGKKEAEKTIIVSDVPKL